MIYILLIVFFLYWLRYNSPLLINFKLVDINALPPTKAYHKAACFDVYASDDITIPVNQWREVPLGISFAPIGQFYIPLINKTFTPLGNVAGRILTRSGYARKKGLRAHLGIMDGDYRAAWSVVLYNHNQEYPVRIKRHDKVAQIEFYRVPSTILTQVNNLSKSLRGCNGFGSSDKQ